jgi:hypothetical protein
MSLPETKTVYFAKGGPENTDATLALAMERAVQLGLRDIVVASTSGATGARAATLFAGFNVIVVNGIYPEKLDATQRQTLEAAGARLVFSGHAFGMLGRAVKRKLGAVQVDEIIALTLKAFSEGVKVAAEVSCMAVDAGLVAPGTEVMAIGGSGRGADSAVVIRAAHTQDFFDLRVVELVCKPR